MDLASFMASSVTSPGERPWAFADTVMLRLPLACSMPEGPLPMLMVAICSSGTIRLLPVTAMGRRSMFSLLTRSAGSRRTATSRVSPPGSTQSPTSIPAKATRRACAASLAEMPMELARPRLSSILSSLRGSCCDKPTSTAPGTWRSLSIGAGDLQQFARVRPGKVDLDRLACTVVQVVQHRVLGADQGAYLLPQLGGQLLGTARARVLRLPMST